MCVWGGGRLAKLPQKCKDGIGVLKRRIESKQANKKKKPPVQQHASLGGFWKGGGDTRVCAFVSAQPILVPLEPRQQRLVVISNFGRRGGRLEILGLLLQVAPRVLRQFNTCPGFRTTQRTPAILVGFCQRKERCFFFLFTKMGKPFVRLSNKEGRKEEEEEKLNCFLCRMWQLHFFLRFNFYAGKVFLKLSFLEAFFYDWKRKKKKFAGFFFFGVTKVVWARRP